MGLLDGLFNLTPEQNQGLMAASARMLELSGPSRVPRSLGQIVGAAYGTYNDSMSEAQQRAELKRQRELQEQLLKWKVQDAEADFTHQQGERARDGRIAGKISKLYGEEDPGPGVGMFGLAPGPAGGLSSTPASTPDPRLDGAGSGLGGLRSLLGDNDAGGLRSIFENFSSGAPSAASHGQQTPGASSSAFPSPFMQSMQALGSSAPPAGRYGAQSYYDAAQQAGLPNPGSMETSNLIIDRVNRLGETPEAAAHALKGGDQALQGMPGGAPGGQASKELGMADWLRFGMSPQQAISMSKSQGGRPRSNMTQKAAERMLAAADIYASENDFDNAEKRYKAATALMPQVDRIEIATDPETNKPVRVITYKNGHEEVSAFGAKPDMVELDLGGTKQFVDKNRMAPGTVYQKTQSPDSKAADARWAARGMGGGGGEASLDADTLDMMADQALRGDRSVFQNIGRGAQGSANLVALRGRITQKAKERGITGADLASITADYGGLVAGLRTSANISARVENAISEARELAPLAITAGRDVARAGLLPFGKAQVMFDTQTNDPALKKFAAANVGFVQAYAGAMARGQKPTVHDKEHAEKLISEATSQKAYEAVMNQLMLEMDAASRAPQKVREHLRSEIGGQGGHGGGAPGGSPTAKPVITLADITETARRSGRSTRDVTAAFRAKGYKIQGDK